MHAAPTVTDPRPVFSDAASQRISAAAVARLREIGPVAPPANLRLVDLSELEERARRAPKALPARPRQLPTVAYDPPTDLLEPEPVRVHGLDGPQPLFRELPFHDRRKVALAAVLSVVAVALFVVYLLVPTVGLSCGAGCTPNPWLQRVYDVLTIATTAISAYFVCLYLVGLTGSSAARWRHSRTTTKPFFVIVTPAHNEELVIGETVRRLRRLDYGHFMAIIMNDGSKDRTSEVAREAAGGDPRIMVIDRPAHVAGKGKGDVLNHAFLIAKALVAGEDPRLAGRGDDRVILGVLDADGWLRPDALKAIAVYYDEPDVAGVQVPVRMYNARTGFLALMQDIEFIGFSVLIQGGRDVFGSTLLGGNGQFVRLQALRSLDPRPWTRSLTEDLDIGLSLVRQGWRNRMCSLTCVAQQAVTSPRRLIRQRTRWVQGHYSCWSHLPGLWRAQDVTLLQRIDLSLHLLLAVTILVVTAQAVLGIIAFAGLLPIGAPLLAGLFESDQAFRIFILVTAIGPLGLLGLAYQRAAVAYQGERRYRLPLWSLPGMLLAFTAYTYFWGLPSTFSAFWRMLRRRDSWAKTERDPVFANFEQRSGTTSSQHGPTAHAQPAEAAA